MDKAVTLAENGKYWRAIFYDENGLRKFRSLGPKKTMSKLDAKRACANLAEQFARDASRRNAPKSGTLGPWLDHYLTLRTDIGDASLVWQNRAVAKLIEFFGPTTKMDDITRADAAAFQASLATAKRVRLKRDGTKSEKPISDFTAHTYLVLAREIFGYALRLDATPTNPFDRLKIRTPKLDKEWAYITHEQTQAMIDAADSHAWKCLIALCRWAGLRRGEARRLTWRDIKWDAKTLRVLAEGERRTTKQGLREVPIQPRLMAVLQAAYDAAEDGATRVCHVSNNNVERTVRVLATRAGFELDDKPLHTLRKNLETDWLADHPVLDVTAWLGNSPNVAAKHYNRTKPETIAKVTGEQSEVERLKAELAALKAKMGVQA